MKSEMEAGLTLTPSVFLFSRLLAAVEKKITMEGPQWPAGFNTYTHTQAQCLFKVGQLQANSKRCMLENWKHKRTMQIKSGDNIYRIIRLELDSSVETI